MSCGLKTIMLALMLISIISAPASAQRKKSKATPPPTKNERKVLAEQLEQTRDDLVEATKEYKKSLEKLLVFYERNVQQAKERKDKLKELQALGLVSKRELEEGEKGIADAQVKVEEVRAQMKAADNVVAQTLEESRLAEQLAKAPPLPPRRLLQTAAYVRYSGAGSWVISEATKVQGFFMSKFGRPLPVSAYGQTPLHDRMGLDHRNSMDVGVTPDSAEGQALMEYLRSAGIPFLAFRQAVPGAATGPHIHVGKPSHRIFKPL